MNKTLLVNPGCADKSTYGALEPFSVASLAGYLLQNGQEVRIVDEMAGDDFAKEFNYFKPDVVGVTSTTQLIRRAYQILDQSRKRGALTVIGGPHASALPEESAKHADIVVRGEGELAILGIARGDIKGGVIKNPPIRDIDSLPLPARELLRMDYYLNARRLFPNHIFNFAPADARTSTLIRTRGCPYRCIFCYNSWRDMPVRSRSVDSVIAELSFLKSKYGVTAVSFMDDEMFFNKRQAAELFSRMTKEKLDLVWSGCARANLVDPELLALAKEAGCQKITIGFESGSQKILDILNKKTTVEQNRKAAKMCKEAGIKIGGYFMIGNPMETLEDIALTRSFIREVALDYVGLFVCTALPGTEIYEKYADKSCAGPEFWETLNFYDYKISVNNILSRETIEQQYESMMTEIYGKRKVDLADVISRHVRHPVYTIKKIVDSPHKLLRLLKRLLGRP